MWELNGAEQEGSQGVQQETERESIVCTFMASTWNCFTKDPIERCEG